MRNWKSRLVAVWCGLMTAAMFFPSPVGAAEPGQKNVEPYSLDKVVENLGTWVTGLLFAVSTLFIVIGGARYVLSGGDPGQVEKAKLAIRGSLVGYAVAILAPVILGVLRSMVGQ